MFLSEVSTPFWRCKTIIPTEEVSLELKVFENHIIGMIGIQYFSYWWVGGDFLVISG